MDAVMDDPYKYIYIHLNSLKWLLIASLCDYGRHQQQLLPL
jgi:hypothetical protein